MPDYTILSPQTHTAPATEAGTISRQEPLKKNGHPVFSQGIRLQPKVTVGAAHDPLEQEADAVADSVMRMPEPFLQRKCAGCEEEEKAQRKPLASFIQKKEAGSNTTSAGDGVSSQIHATRGGGHGMDRSTKSFMESRFGADFSTVRIHTGGYAAQMSQELNAQAFTVGNDIYFGVGKYAPESAEGKHLLAHELTHTVQQAAQSTVIQREVVEMPAQTVTVGMPSNLSSLSTPASAGTMTMAHAPAHIASNSQIATTPLPFTTNGWNGNEIAEKLGQYDQIPGTDSDAVRCVQAVALVSHILMGPAAAMDYLSSMVLQGMLQAARIETRQRTALNVIRFVKEQIKSRRATYGDMYWAMEAVHDLFYADNKGTPADTAAPVREQITPMLDFSQRMVDMDIWCGNKTELMAQAATLNPGEQFMLNLWSVSFNYYFDEAGAAPTDQRFTYNRIDERGRGRLTTIRRINATTTKPRGNQIDTNRDHKSGHQMLIFKDAADSHIKMYEPELTSGGAHSFDLTNDPSLIETMLFFDQPQFELYKYLQIWGKLVPTPMPTFG